MEFEQKQKRVKLGIAIGGIGGLLVLFVPLVFNIVPDIAIDNFEQRISLGVASCLALTIALAIPVMIVAHQRLTNPDAIDGQTNIAGSIAINLRIIQNTLEQTVLAAIAFLAFACFAPDSHLGLLPIITGWWLLCRLLFSVGYHLGDNARAFGFAGSYLGTVWLLILDFFYLIT